MATYKELMSELQNLRAQAEQARLAEKEEVLARVRELIIEHGLQPSDFGFAQGRKPKTGTVPAKYRDPSTGATWSGRGRSPKWLEGQDRSSFEIQR